MGLLDSFDSDQFRLGLGLLAAGGARGDGMGFGGRVQEAFGGLDAYKKQKAEAEYRKTKMEQEREALQLEKQKRERAAYDEDAVKRYFSPAAGGDEANAGQVPRLDPRQFLSQNPQASMGALEQAMKFDQAFNPAKKLMNVPDGNVVLDETTGQPVYTAPGKPDKPDSKITQFEYAKQNGFRGSFEQFMTLGPSIMAGAMAPLRDAQVGNINAENAYNLPPPRKSAGGVSVTIGGRSFSFPDQKSANNFKMKAGVR